ncbi:MAG: alpha/beta fold hydrolase [Bacteroidia bacterium]
MKLHYKKTGEGKPLFILHGLFGLGDNWMTFSNTFSSLGFACYAIDLRNHGRSPHSDDISYSLMAADVKELMDDLSIDKIILMGHSMGGKVAMFFSELFPERVEKLIVVDIAPRYYAPHHQNILSALHAVDLQSAGGRKQVEEQLRVSIHDEATLQFLLKNLYWKEDNRLDWRFHLNGLEKHIDAIGVAFSPKNKISVPALFIRGEKSGYIQTGDENEIKSIFMDVEIVTVPNAGHWVHAENPKGFAEKVETFLRH